MLTNRSGSGNKTKSAISNTTPNLSVKKLGVVSRDYEHKFKNRFPDFSYALPDILKRLDDEGCDAVLFSLFSIESRKSFESSSAFRGLKNVTAIILEEYQRGKDENGEITRDAKRVVVHYRTKGGWKEYEVEQQFGSISGMSRKAVESFVTNELPGRVMGNSSLVLCGETNGVKYSKKRKCVEDTFGLRSAIPKGAKIVLNPIHDRMTRFEMKLKRQFLSEKGRWVVSVWNKGKKDKNGAVRDGSAPAWTAYHNGKEVSITPIDHDFPKIEIGVLNIP